MKDLVTDHVMMKIHGDVEMSEFDQELSGCSELKIKRFAGNRHQFFHNLRAWARDQSPDQAAIGVIISEEIIAVWFKNPQYWTLFNIMFGDWIET